MTTDIIQDARPRFMILQHDILSYKLKPSQLAVYIALLSYANNQTAECYPSYKTIAGIAQVSERTAQKAVDVLVKLGIIEKHENYKQGQQINNTYKLILFDHKTTRKPGGGENITPLGAKILRGGGENIAPELKEVKQDEVKQPIVASATGEPPHSLSAQQDPEADANAQASTPPPTSPAPPLPKPEHARVFEVAQVYAQYQAGDWDATPPPKQVSIWIGKKSSGVIGQLCDANPDLTADELRAMLKWYTREKHQTGHSLLGTVKSLQQYLLEYRKTNSKPRRTGDKVAVMPYGMGLLGKGA